jgi:hypothetical protein
MQHEQPGVRAVVPDVLSAEECAELTFVHRALGAAGYSPHLWTSKLSDIAYAEPALLLPVVSRPQNQSALSLTGHVMYMHRPLGYGKRQPTCSIVHCRLQHGTRLLLQQKRPWDIPTDYALNSRGW